MSRDDTEQHRDTQKQEIARHIADLRAETQTIAQDKAKLGRNTFRRDQPSDAHNDEHRSEERYNKGNYPSHG
jgi:hypothetical protein